MDRPPEGKTLTVGRSRLGAFRIAVILLLPFLILTAILLHMAVSGVLWMVLARLPDPEFREKVLRDSWPRLCILLFATVNYYALVTVCAWFGWGSELRIELSRKGIAALLARDKWLSRFRRARRHSLSEKRIAWSAPIRLELRMLPQAERSPLESLNMALRSEDTEILIPLSFREIVPVLDFVRDMSPHLERDPLAAWAWERLRSRDGAKGVRGRLAAALRQFMDDACISGFSFANRVYQLKKDPENLKRLFERLPSYLSGS